MKTFPTDQLNPKVKSAWRLNDALWLTVIFACCAIPLALVVAAGSEAWSHAALVAVCIAYVVCMVIWMVVLPPIRFARWRYSLSEDYLDIAKGIIWRKRYIIPFIRVQNTDTRQGPILRAFGLASVTVATAAGEHEIPGLEFSVAEEVRDRAAELARTAQEDV